MFACLRPPDFFQCWRPRPAFGALLLPLLRKFSHRIFEWISGSVLCPNRTHLGSILGSQIAKNRNKNARFSKLFSEQVLGSIWMRAGAPEPPKTWFSLRKTSFLQVSLFRLERPPPGSQIDSFWSPKGTQTDTQTHPKT